MSPPRWALLPTFAFLATLVYVYYYLSTPSVELATPGITHIVMFQWKDSAEEAAIAEVSTSLSLASFFMTSACHSVFIPSPCRE